MAEPFLAEVRMMSFGFPPKGWAFCNGQLLPINQNQGLFSLLGTTFGGDGRQTFGLPNLQGRVPIHTGGQGGHTLGQMGGETSHTISIPEMPSHNHTLTATTVATTTNLPSGNLLAQSAATDPVYSDATNLVLMGPSSIANNGGSQPHTNLQPFLTINFSIALQGIFPSQT